MFKNDHRVLRTTYSLTFYTLSAVGPSTACGVLITCYITNYIDYEDNALGLICIVIYH